MSLVAQHKNYAPRKQLCQCLWVMQVTLNLLFLPRFGLHENYVMSRTWIPPELFMYVMSGLSFPATGPPDPGTDFKSPGKSNASSISTPSWRVFKGFLKAFWRGFEGSSGWPLHKPSKTLQDAFRNPFRDPFKNPSETLLGSGVLSLECNVLEGRYICEYCRCVILRVTLRAFVGTGKRGHYKRGLFNGGISRISKFSRFSRISRKWPDSPLFSRVWGFSKISRISRFSRISRKWTFLKRPLFQKTPFSEPDFGGSIILKTKSKCLY